MGQMEPIIAVSVSTQPPVLVRVTYHLEGAVLCAGVVLPEGPLIGSSICPALQTGSTLAIAGVIPLPSSPVSSLEFSGLWTRTSGGWTCRRSDAHLLDCRGRLVATPTLVAEPSVDRAHPPFRRPARR